MPKPIVTKRNGGWRFSGLPSAYDSNGNPTEFNRAQNVESEDPTELNSDGYLVERNIISRWDDSGPAPAPDQFGVRISPPRAEHYRRWVRPNGTISGTPLHRDGQPRGAHRRRAAIRRTNK